MKHAAILSVAIFGAALPLLAATHNATNCVTPLILKGDQTGATIRIYPTFLSERWNEATAIYAKGKPKFLCPATLGVRSEGDGWWEVFRKEISGTFVWTGAAGDMLWENPRNWGEAKGGEVKGAHRVPGRLDTVRFSHDAKVKMPRDMAVSNLYFSAQIAFSHALHVQRTLGRGGKAILRVRESSCLGDLRLKNGAKVLPYTPVPGYGAELQNDFVDGFIRTKIFRKPAVYVWTGGGNDGKWWNVANWRVRGKKAVETPLGGDKVIFPKQKNSKKPLEVELPRGVTAVSNLVMQTRIVWNRDAERGFLDVFDTSGNKEIVLEGNIQFAAKGILAVDTPIVAKKGTVLACDWHDHRRYKDVTIEDGATLAPYQWTVEFDKLVLKPGHSLVYGPPPLVQRFHPPWVMHAMHLEGEPKYPEIPWWHGKLEKLEDGSSLIGFWWGP